MSAPQNKNNNDDSTSDSCVKSFQTNEETNYPLVVPQENISFASHRLFAGVLRQAIDAEHALYWLSSLGGAFSNLGEHSESWATKAGENALQQLKIVLMLEDPSLISRCKLFLALSFIQRNELKKAKKVLLSVYNTVKNSRSPNEKILTMTRGIWSKLQYSWNISKQLKQIE